MFTLFKKAAIFSRFVMVPRLFAAARAMRSGTCVDVIQPCWEEVGRKWLLSRGRERALGTRLLGQKSTERVIGME